ncbi:Ribosomal RNA small subunit methyltransferase D [Caulifigura coniformis]|uniref:Ribosomal RNA small subunit methyltransferase D n=1 Tax=Caulifigura coniformis TaxID=2527983 RepID=A0A517S9R6_9PLAN|nr:RsmD family RNA methyltransferase [Caulifigura coniformis]QDT52875.1 Ribosomal RNA small subunit methyltransferase D [Caulifigura coniformis]
MRIIAGEFRHRVLLSNPGETTRPITDRVKESLFARLEHELPGKRVADIFSGTGTIGFEAISRGAATAVFIDADRKAFELLRENVSKLKIAERTLCWMTNAIRCGYRPKNAGRFTPFDVIFFDPPYKMADDIRPGEPIYKALERLARPDVSADDALLVLRVPEYATYELPPAWKTEWQLTMSNMLLDVCRKQPVAAPSPDDGPSTEEEPATS